MTPPIDWFRNPGLDGPTPVTVSGRSFPTNRGGLCKKGWTSAELLARRGARLGSVVLGEPTLEDVFLTLTGRDLR